MSVILSKAKNPGLGGETLRFAQGDKGVAQGDKGEFRLGFRFRRLRFRGFAGFVEAAEFL